MPKCLQKCISTHEREQSSKFQGATLLNEFLMGNPNISMKSQDCDISFSITEKCLTCRLLMPTAWQQHCLWGSMTTEFCPRKTYIESGHNCWIYPAPLSSYKAYINIIYDLFRLGLIQVYHHLDGRCLDSAVAPESEWRTLKPFKFQGALTITTVCTKSILTLGTEAIILGSWVSVWYPWKRLVIHRILIPNTMSYDIYNRSY